MSAFSPATQQIIRFTRGPDSVRLAFAESGAGEPLIKTANWLSHLEFDWRSPVWRHWFTYLSARHRFVRYDARGCGLSDWNVADFSFEKQVADLEAVIEASGLERFALLGISQGGPVAVEYAARHPHRVSKLILYSAFARGWYRRNPRAVQQARALFDLIPFGWGQENPAFRKIFSDLFIPEASDEQARWWEDLMRVTTKPEIAAKILTSFGEVDVRERLQAVKAPTLVLHASEDACIPFGLGRELAAGIPGAQLREIKSRNHVLLESEPGWREFCAALDGFLGAESPSRGKLMNGRALEALTERERKVLELVANGLSNAEIAATLFISEKTVRNHLTHIFAKLSVESRARAIVLARESGVLGP